MKNLQVLAFFDNTSGHEKQTRAILKSLTTLTSVNISEKSVRPRSMATWLRYFFENLRCKSLRDPSPEDHGPDLIIGTGSNCHLPMLIAGCQHPGAKIITCMTPDKFLLNQFDLCLVPIHDRLPEGPTIFRTIGPPCLVNDQRRHQSDRGLILIGGIDHKSHYWDTTEIVAQIGEILSRWQIKWTVSSSPRTTEDTVLALAELCSRYSQAEFFRAENTPPGWIEEQYHENAITWVTADSVSMLYEALSAGCQIGILPVKWRNSANKFQCGISSLAEKNLLISYDQWLGGASFPDQQTEFNEAGRCAREILKRWWPARLN